MHPVGIHFGEAIPIAAVGLGVNIASAWLLSRGGHHGHSHGPGHGHEREAHAHDDEARQLETSTGPATLSIFEDGVPPRFRLAWKGGRSPTAATVVVRTERPDGAIQVFQFADLGDHLESLDEIPEPHAFTAQLCVDGLAGPTAVFEEHDHGESDHSRDNNMRAAVIHVAADAAVSVLVIAGRVLARLFGWVWMDPVAGLVGAFVIASWSYGLIRDTGAILLDMNPDQALADQIRRKIESCGDAVADLHLWRLGPGHLGAIVGVATSAARDEAFYREKLARFRNLSHLTIEIVRRQAAA
jgi:cation diffusion facilitator family transporter